ncbi:uncharacterized protein Fot_24651 [Forsythia ovata]|uniref:Uncharacterized protein n=1 Tax=Forsythia ovata TaxID=205694 RepID=A0ABD1U7W1_9LAMI
MAAHYSPRKSSGPVLRSLSPSGRFSHQYSSRSLHGQSSHTTSSFASTTSSTFTNARSFQRPTSPTRVNMYNYTNRSVRFTQDRPTSPNRSISVSSREKTRVAPGQKRTCMCSPTNHPDHRRERQMGPPKSGRAISQQAFDEMVKENMEDLGMDPTEALQDAIQTLTL